MKLKFCLALFLIQSTFATDDLLSKLLTYHIHYDKFMRTYLGCKVDATRPEDCNVSDGHLDLDEWKASRELAKKLYNLKEN